MISFAECFESSHSFTIPGVTFRWQSTHSWELTEMVNANIVQAKRMYVGMVCFTDAFATNSTSVANVGHFHPIHDCFKDIRHSIVFGKRNVYLRVITSTLFPHHITHTISPYARGNFMLYFMLLLCVISVYCLKIR